MHNLIRNTIPLDAGLCRDRDHDGGGLATMLQRLEDERSAALDFIDRTVAGAEEASRDLTASERETLTNTRSRVTELDEQIAPMRDFAELRSASRAGGARYTPTPTPTDDNTRGVGGVGGPGSLGGPARTNPRGHEYQTRGQVIVDILRAAETVRGGQNDEAARSRLLGAGVLAGATEDQLRAISNEITSDVPGLLPKPIVGAVQSDIDAARPFVTSIGAKDMSNIPGKTFTRPVVTQHTVAGKQTTEKTELPSQKLTVGGVDFTKETHGGALDVSRQVIDWTSPEAWDALLADLQDAYALQTEDVAADAFVAAVVGAASNTVELTTAAAGTPTVNEWITAMYSAAAGAYGDVKRLPNAMWVSLDRWATMGAVIDQLKASSAGTGGGGGSVSAFEGNMLSLPRYVVPSFPNGTVIVGVKEKTEFYEEKIGLLSAVEPRLLGVEIAYGGYIAYGTINAKGYRAIVNAV